MIFLVALLEKAMVIMLTLSRVQGCNGMNSSWVDGKNNFEKLGFLGMLVNSRR